MARGKSFGVKTPHRGGATHPQPVNETATVHARSRSATEGYETAGPVRNTAHCSMSARRRSNRSVRR